MDISAEDYLRIQHQTVGLRFKVMFHLKCILLVLMVNLTIILKFLTITIGMLSEDENIDASIRVALLLILDCSSCQSYQRVQRTLPCQHTVCNKCIERSRRTGVLTCADCGTLHKIPKEWTRLFPINLQLHEIANCTDMYRARVASPKNETTIESSGGGDRDDVSNDEKKTMPMLLEQLKILETSQEIYAEIFRRINEDINRLHSSGEEVKLIVRERMQELISLIDSREVNLLEQINQLKDHETGILNTQLIQHKNEREAINLFCIEAREVLSAGEVTITNIDKLTNKSSRLIDIFRQAKTSRSRVPKTIVFVDRSAPKKRLKANINTFGKVIVESAMNREDGTALDVVTKDVNSDYIPSNRSDNPRQPKIMLESEEQEDKTIKKVDIVEDSSSLYHPDIVHLPVPMANVTGDVNSRSIGHLRCQSFDSGIEVTSRSSSPLGYLTIHSPDPVTGARRKVRPPSHQTVHRDYSQLSVKLRVGGFGRRRDNFNVPKGITAVKDDVFAVADCGNNAVKLFQSSKNQAIDFINCEDVLKFSLPSVVDVCTFSSTSLLVSISRKGKILHYTAKGNFVSMYNITTTSETSDIWGITTDFNENVYVCDRANGCVLEFDKQIKLIRKFSSSSTGKKSCPFYVAVGPCGRIFTTDTMSNTVLIFTKDGSKYIEISGENHGKEFIKFEGLAGLAFDSSGNLLIVDRKKSKIVVMERRMENQYLFSTDITNIGKPEGIAVLANGEVVVSETSHHEALIF